MYIYSISRYVHETEQVQLYYFDRNVWKNRMTNDCFTTDEEEANLTFEGILSEGQEGYEVALQVYRLEY